MQRKGGIKDAEQKVSMETMASLCPGNVGIFPILRIPVLEDVSICIY